MLLHLKSLLQPAELEQARALLLADDTPWISGAITAGDQALHQKNNQQLAQDSDRARQLREMILAAVRRDPLFFSAALPRRIFNPLFNRYSGETNYYGAHVDGAVLHSRASGEWVRTDLSCTVFLCEPDEYGGGELVVHDNWDQQMVKLPAGDAVLYSGTSVHEVLPVTRGARIASFFWVESMVSGDQQRQLLFDLDMALLTLRKRHGESLEATRLTGVYHNLLRLWANT